MKSRRLIGRIILALAFLILVTAVGQAQTDPIPQSDNKLINIENPLKAMIDGVVTSAPSANSVNAMMSPIWLSAAEEPSDSCSDAPLLIVFPSNPADGGVAEVANATSANDDPVLACIWGNPTRPQGYRTVWYKLFAPVNGRVTIDTFGSNYDTILGIHTGTCEVEDPDNPPPPLETIGCNDDHNLFSSQVTFPISQGTTYYIEVADRELGTPLPPMMALSALLEPVDSKWVQTASIPGPPPNSRHAVVAQDPFLYLVGGQTGEAGLPQISPRLVRFNANTLKWDEMAKIPGAGYSNTTAALVGNKIFVPTGYNGGDLYDGIHWAYTIDPNPHPDNKGYWQTVANTPKPHGVPFAWASAAVPPSQNKYYLTGGLSSTNANIPPVIVEDKVVNNSYVYLVDSDSWLEQKPMNAGRYAHTATWIEQNGLGICVAGGLGVQDDPDTGFVTVLHRSAECYQPGGNWHFVAEMNIPRFGAGSSVGPDGKWYVYGGMTAVGNILLPVTQTEVYDPIRDTWTIMDPSYNLGNFQTNPGRFWPRGGMLGNNLWVVGGSIFSEDGEQASPVMERLTIPSHTNYMPVLGGNYDDGTRPDDTFAQARPISFGLNQTRNFDHQRDFFDVYTFEIQSPYSIQVRLIVPEDNNFDVEVYGRQKTKWGPVTNSPKNGVDEEFVINNLPPNRYYVVVSRKFPTGQPDKGAYYTISVK